MIYSFEDYELDTALFELRHTGEPYPLEPQVFELLRYLVEHHERVVPKDEILDHIWPERYITEAALNSRLMAARKAIGDNGREQRLIRTIHGRGYRFVGYVTVPATEALETAANFVAGEGGAASGTTLALPAAQSAQEMVSVPPAPSVQFAATPDGAFNIAYAVLGEGVPLVRVPGWFTHLDLGWRWPHMRRLWMLLAQRFMLVRYDGRGVGLSDPTEEFSVHTRVADLEAVVEALGLERFALLGTSSGGTNTAVRYAAMNPGRVTHLITYGGGANVLDENQHRAWIRQWEMHLQVMRHGWGKDLPIYRRLLAELLLGNTTHAEDVDFLAELHRVAAPARRAARLVVTSVDNELAELAPRVTAPTLITHARDDPAVPLARAQRLAALIPGARMLVLDGARHWLLADEPGIPEFIRAVWDFAASPDEDVVI